MIDYEEIRKELAVSHNALIAKDDPILIAATLHELMFRKYVDILLEKQATHLKVLEAAQQRGIADAKLTVGRVITEGGNYVSEHARSAVKAALDEGIERLNAIEKKKEESKPDIKSYLGGAFAMGASIIVMSLIGAAFKVWW